MTCHPLRLSFKFTPGFVLRLRLASTTRDSDGLETHLRYQFGPSFALLLHLRPSHPPNVSSSTASWLGHGEEKTLSIVWAVSGIVAAGELFRSRWYRKYGGERDVIELI